MADLSITATAIIPVDGHVAVSKPAASAITQGQAVFENSSGQWQIADADAAATCIMPLGIALTEATAATQPILAIVSGDLGMGAILTVNTIYTVAETAGAIQPVADLLSGDYLGVLGVATTTSNLRMLTYASGAVTA